MNKIPTLALHGSVFFVSLLLCSCATRQEGMVASEYASQFGTEVASRGPVAEDDASMSNRQSSSRVAQGSSNVTPKGVRLTEKQTEKIGSDTPASAKEEVLESSSTMTTTVLGATAVAAPDAEVKMTNH